MSYILDALRRAQAQRERGSVPDIHALPQGTGASLPAPPRAGSPLVWAAAGVVVIVAMLLAWWLLGQREPARDVVTMAPVPAAMPAPAQSVAPVLAQPVAPAPLPSTVQLQPPAAPVPPAVAPTSAPLPGATVVPSAAPAGPARPAAKEPKTAAPAQRTVAATVPAAPSAPAPATAPGPAAAVNEPRIYTHDELPSDIRAQLPQVKISGSSYSESPSSRMLIANGQVFYENEKIAPDTTLVQIRPSSAILSFRGFRYAVPF